MNYLLDTNIISAIMENNKDVVQELEEKIILGKKVFISGINYYEIKRGLLIKANAKKLRVFSEIIKMFEVLLLDELEIFDKASEIYKNLISKGKPIGNEKTGDADILIAALIQTKNLILVTDNIKHFNRIPDIKVENWLRSKNNCKGNS